MTKTVTYHNHSFAVHPNNEVEANFWDRFNNRQWEADVLDFYFAKRRKGVFLDIGSWIGPVSLPMSQIYDKVYSVDLDPVARKHFLQNVELNRIQNIVPVAAGLSNKRGTIKLDPAWFGSSETSLFYSGKNGVEVDLITFGELIDAIPEKDQISFIKIDIEGAEFKILSDIYPFIARRSCMTVISYHPHNMKEWHLSPWAWKLFKFRHALKQLRFRKYFFTPGGVVEIRPYDFAFLLKSRFALADALES